MNKQLHYWRNCGQWSMRTWLCGCFAHPSEMAALRSVHVSFKSCSTHGQDSSPTFR